MPRKPTVPCYKTTDKIERACKQLFEYDYFNFWYFEFAVRAFSLYESRSSKENFIKNIAKLLSTLSILRQEPHTCSYFQKQLNQPNGKNILEDYTLDIRSIFNEQDEIFTSIKEELSINDYKNFKYTYEQLKKITSKYGVYPHYLMGQKSFANRYQFAVDEEATQGSSTAKKEYLYQDTLIEEDNFNKNFLETWSPYALYVPMAIPIIDFGQGPSREHLRKLLCSYKRNQVFFTSKNRIPQIFENTPVTFCFLDTNFNRDVEDSCETFSFYISLYEKNDIQYILDFIITIITNDKNEVDSKNNSLVSEKYIDNSIFKISVKKNISQKIINDLKKHIQAEMELYYYVNILHTSLSFSYLYQVMILYYLKYSDEDIDIFLKNKYAIKNLDSINLDLQNDSILKEQYYALMCNGNIKEQYPEFSKFDLKEIYNSINRDNYKDNCLKNAYNIDKFKLLKKDLNDECDLIDYVHKFIHRPQWQLSNKTNSLGLFIFDLKQNYSMQLEHIYTMLLAETDEKFYTSLATYPKAEKDFRIREDILLVRKTIADQKKKKMEMEVNMNKTDDKELGRRTLRHAYEQVQRHIENHLRHPFYQ